MIGLNARAGRVATNCRSHADPHMASKAPGGATATGPETVATGKKLIGGRPITGIYNVSQPTMTLYAPKRRAGTCPPSSFFLRRI